MLQIRLMSEGQPGVLTTRGLTTIEAPRLWVDLHYRVILTSVNKIETMFEGPGENVKFEQGSIFTFTANGKRQIQVLENSSK